MTTNSDKLYGEKLKKRLLAKRFITSSSCWLWIGASNGSNYGRIHTLWGNMGVHRLSLQLFKPEEYTATLDVLHSCNNPRCYNPAHLKSGNDSDNMKDAVLAGTHVSARKTSCPKGHEYNLENTYPRAGTTWRGCKTCRRDAAIIYRLLKGN